MNFLSPMAMVYAAAAAVPLLVLLYFLKLRRQQVAVSSTLLWKRAVQDLQVNAPFQRIRYSILLLLQLLAILAVVAALGRPVVSLTTGPPRRYVLLIDRSASMNALDGRQGAKVSRLDEAKRQARELIASLRTRATLALQDSSDQAMVVAFDEHAKVMCNFTSDKGQLDAAIEGIQPTDASTSLSEAVMVARAFAQPPGEATNNRSAETAARLELYSDGRISDGDTISVASDELTFHRVGSAARNVGVVAMQARRNFEKPEEVEVFATLANYDDHAADADVALSVEGGVRSVRKVHLPPRAAARTGQSVEAPSTTAVSFTLTYAAGGVIEVRALTGDLLASDDAAWSVLPPPRTLSALLVTRGNAALASALKACPLARLDVRTPEQFDQLDRAALEANPPYDVIVLDNHPAAQLPRGRYLIFGRPPKACGVAADTELKNQVVVDWRSRHPVLEFVNLANLYASKCYRMALPSDASVLAEFGEAPAMALVRRGGSLFLLVPFDPLESNWPFEPSFVMFCYNATAYLGTEVGQEQRYALRVNQAISLENLPAGASARVTGPGMSPADLPVSASGALRFPGTARAGVYAVTVAAKSPVRFAVNLLSAAESNILPADGVVLSGQTVAAQPPGGRGNVEIWPWLAALALLLVCVEWLVYNLKVRL